MKKLQRAALTVMVAVMLVACALGVAACDRNDDAGKQKYTMTFMVGTMVYDTVTVTEGKSYTIKEDPVKANNVFEGWSRTENGRVEPLPEKMPSEDRTYYAVFSPTFTLTLNAGIGSIPEEQKTMSVKVGANLYSTISSVTPTVSDGDATFDGWYLRSNKITEGSVFTMPGSNTEVVAKYTVGYTVNVYKEADLDSGDYGEPFTVIENTAFVGETVTGLPSYTGFRYDGDMDSTALTEELKKDSAQNVLAVYYEIIGYEAEFNVNLPEGVEYDGETEPLTCGYRLTYEAPECGYEADGYRFQGWATSPNGNVTYYPGDEFSIDRTTIFYAKWVKGLTELTGISSDRVYVMGKVGEPNVTVAYLERVGLKDILGTYDTTTHVFTFKSVVTDDGEVLLRGVADTTRNTFTYLNTDSSTAYKLLGAEGASAPTVTLSDNGGAVYNDGAGHTVNGTYFGDEDGSLVLVANAETLFVFRLVMSDDGIVNYEVRGDEYGLWYDLSQDGSVDTSGAMFLDGYGYAMRYVFGSSTSTVVGGVYEKTAGFDGAYNGDAGVEILATFYNSSFSYRSFVYLLMEGTFTVGTTKVNNVCLQRFSATLYGAPAEGGAVDTATADKLELTGYSILDDGAVYSYNNGSETVTVKGKYVYDDVFGTITVIPATGDKLVFEISGSAEDTEGNTVNVFALETAEECGRYTVISNLVGSSSYYDMYFYNDNVAAFAFAVTSTDSFYGIATSKFAIQIIGKYELVLAGSEDASGNVYEFTAPVYSSVYSMLYNAYGSNALSFFKFKFQFVYSNGRITSISVVAKSDFTEGEFTYDGVTYELDGYGSAVGTNSEGKEIKRSYVYNTSLGFGRLFVTVPTHDNPSATVMFVDLDEDGVYTQFETNYVLRNANTTVVMLIMKDGTASLMLAYVSGYNYVYTPFSYGNVVWTDQTHTAGSYSRNTSVDFGLPVEPLAKTYAGFKFTIVSTSNNGQTTNNLYIYDFGTATPNEDGKYVITNAAGDVLTLDTSAGATYVKKGAGDEEDETYQGNYYYFDDTVQLVYASNKAITFRIIRGGDGTLSFEVVGNETCYAIYYDDLSSYLYLSGKSSGTDGTFVGTYYLYDAETKEYTAYDGTYTRNANGINGYDFTYIAGGEQQTFTFAVTKSSAGVTMFRTYTRKLASYVFTMNAANIGKPQVYGTLTGGEFSDQVFTVSGQSVKYTGKYEVFDEENGVYTFTSTAGYVFYFKDVNGVILYLDGTYVGAVKGVFDLSEPIVLDIAAQEATEDSPAIPAHKATVTKVEMSGFGLAYLTYEYEGAERTVTALYVQVASSTFALVDGNGSLLARIRLLVRTTEEGRVYYAQPADTETYGIFVSNEMAVLNLNGFGSAVYVDAYGTVHTGSYTKGENGVICITYIDTHAYVVVRVYVTLGEDGIFTVVPAPADTDTETEALAA